MVWSEAEGGVLVDKKQTWTAEQQVRAGKVHTRLTACWRLV